jgi:Protein of unknown function (DUF3710)
MALRRRQKRTERSKIDATPPWESRHRDEPEPTAGPFDEKDAPEDDLARVDLGALRVPVWPGVDLRVDVDEAQRVVSVTLANGNGHMQLGVFAAPRNEGIWESVREEIRESMRAQHSGSVRVADGTWGAELVGTVQAEAGKVPVRFLGVDGPRWFVRAMLVGAVAVDAAKAAPFERAFRNLVVVRGSEPLPVREPVPLRLPKEVVDQTGQDADSSPPQS